MRRQAGQRCDFRRHIRIKFQVKKSKERRFLINKHRKIRWFSLIFGKAKQWLEKLVKYVPCGHQKAPLGEPEASKTP